MELVDRPHGWTLTEALSELQVEVFRTAFAASAKSGFQRDHGRQVAWEGIAPQLERAELHATGVPTEGKSPEEIDPGFAMAAAPDFDANTLSLNGTVYAGVRVWRGISAQPKQTGFAGRPTSRPLLESEMRARAKLGTIHPRLAAEVRHLRDWLKEYHPTAGQPGQSAAENGLRDLFKELTKSLK